MPTTDPALYRSRLPPKGALLALDQSPRRIGVAATDPGRVLVTPLECWRRRDLARDLARIGDHVRRRGAVGLVVGHPVSMDGRIGPMAQQAEAFARRLEEEFGLPVLLQDERLSTFAVEEAVREGRLRPRRGERWLDHYAAALILEDALSALARLPPHTPR